MRLKITFFALLFLFFGASIYAQNGNNNRVTVEDPVGANSEYKENDQKYRELDKEFDELMKHFMKIYREMKNQGYSKVGGTFSKERLGVFISEAKNYKKNIKNNAKVSSLNNQLNELAKVTSRGAQPNRVELLNSKINEVESDISAAELRIADIEKNESKEELSVGFGNTSSSTTNTNSSTPTSDSNSNETSQSSSNTQSNASTADLHYQNALARQQVYNQNLEIAATQLVNVGASIVNDIQQARIRNVAEKNKYISQYLNKVIILDKECSDLYINNNYQAFLIKEKELRKYENYIIDHLNWLIDKEGDSRYRKLKKEVFSNQIIRLKQILQYDTEEILKNPNNYKNMNLVNYCSNVYLEELKDLGGDLVDDKGFFNSKSNPTSMTNYSWFVYWREFIDEERRERTRRILELNKTNNLLDTYHELAFYLSNNYGNSEQDEKLVKYFLNSSTELKESLTNRLVYARNYKNITRSDMQNDRIYIRDDKHLRFLLGSLEEKIYSYEFEDVSTKKRNKKPLHKLLNDSDFGLKNSKTNELLKKWIKSGEKIIGKRGSNVKLQREIIKLQFFEARSDFDHSQNKAYTNKFSKSSRIVYASIEFINPNHNLADFSADLKMYYYYQDGTLINSPNIENIIPKAYPTIMITGGWGYAETGENWTIGRYTVEVWTGDLLLKTGYFTIY
ncbi:hypothetical protein [Aureibaculum luteum]|uniref:hypothetical protein n=1 Tax=Aureibaculum luteum TaxID=1548456 RepID=UPI000E4C4597|nr:hypothetical protein [Aureibaculum luteum]